MSQRLPFNFCLDLPLHRTGFWFESVLQTAQSNWSEDAIVIIAMESCNRWSEKYQKPTFLTPTSVLSGSMRVQPMNNVKKRSCVAWRETNPKNENLRRTAKLFICNCQCDSGQLGFSSSITGFGYFPNWVVGRTFYIKGFCCFFNFITIFYFYIII